MYKPQNFFFALMQLGIGTRKSTRLETLPTEETWKAVMQMAQKQAVLGIVVDGMLKLPAEYLPPAPIKLKGIQQLLRIEQLNRRLNGEAVQVSEFLQAEGYACTILKGQGIAQYYPNPLHRMPGDIDVWPDAEPDVLRKYGRKKFYDKEWSALQHIMRHLFSEGIGLRQLTDYALVLRKGMIPAEKEEALQTLRRLNMEGFTEAVMYVLQTVFALEPEYLLCAPDERKGKLLLEEILEGGNFGFYDRRGDKRNLANKVKKRAHKFLRVFSLAPSEAVWSFLFFTRAFFLRRWHRLKLSS